MNTDRTRIAVDLAREGEDWVAVKIVSHPLLPEGVVAYITRLEATHEAAASILRAPGPRVSAQRLYDATEACPASRPETPETPEATVLSLDLLGYIAELEAVVDAARSVFRGSRTCEPLYNAVHAVGARPSYLPEREPRNVSRKPRRAAKSRK